MSSAMVCPGTQRTSSEIEMAKHLISSTRTIEAMKADKHRLSDGDGLYIKQTPSGKKHWYQDYTLKDGLQNLRMQP